MGAEFGQKTRANLNKMERENARGRKITKTREEERKSVRMHTHLSCNHPTLQIPLPP